MKRQEAPSVKVPLVIPRKQTFACQQRDRIILPTLMLILPGKPPRVLVRFSLAGHPGA